MLNKILEYMRQSVQHYKPDKYWKMRNYIQNNPNGNKIKTILYSFRIKRMDAFNNASTGIKIGGGSAFFETRPRLPYGLYGIIIAPGAYIGKNVTIFHQVTIGNDYKDITHCPHIGDNVTIYPGAKIVGKITIGNNVTIGANAVVNKDVADNTLVVVNQPRLIEREK